MVSHEVDLVVAGGIVLTADQDWNIHDPGAVAVDRGAIVGLGPREEVERAYRGWERIDASGKLVIADFAARDIERLQTFLRIAEDTERQLVILSKDAYLLEAMHLISPEVPELKSSSDILIYQDLKARPDNWEKKIRQERYPEKMVAAPEIQSSPGDYNLCFI